MCGFGSQYEYFMAHYFRIQTSFFPRAGQENIQYIGRFKAGLKHGRGIEFDEAGRKVYQGECMRLMLAEKCSVSLDPLLKPCIPVHSE